MLFRRIFSSAMASVLRPATYAPYDGGRRHSHAPRQRNRGLMIEPLEQRQLLSVCQWTGAAGNGDWSNAANWLKNQIPTASDDAVIRGASKPVVIPATAIQNKAIAVDGLELDDSTLDVEGELTIGGMFQWSDYARLKGAGSHDRSGRHQLRRLDRVPRRRDADEPGYRPLGQSEAAVARQGNVRERGRRPAGHP